MWIVIYIIGYIVSLTLLIIDRIKIYKNLRLSDLVSFMIFSILSWISAVAVLTNCETYNIVIYKKDKDEIR